MLFCNKTYCENFLIKAVIDDYQQLHTVQRLFLLICINLEAANSWLNTYIVKILSYRIGAL